jgi:hypothetical protein
LLPRGSPEGEGGLMNAELDARRTAAAAVLTDFNRELHSAPLSNPPGREWMFRLADVLDDLLYALGTGPGPGHKPAAPPGQEPPPPERRPPGSMDADAARQLGRHAKAALLHLSQAEDLAVAGGVDLDYVYASEPGAGPLFRAAREAMEDLDLWAINNASANGAGRETYDHTERWCHRPGGVFPAAGSQDVTPARMRALAGQAEALAAAIDSAKEGFRAHSADYEDPVRRAGFRLDDAAGQARSIAGELQETAADLARIAARPEGSCTIPWGACPEHGNTLTSTGRKTWCTAAGCGRGWGYDRVTMPCAEPARWKVTDQHGAGGLLCDGHALDARQRLEGATVVPLSAPPDRGVPGE